MSINRVIISGNLTRDPELRTTQGGMPVLSLGVAVNERVKNNQTGEWTDRPNFIECTMFGTRAESVSRFLSKGSKVAIEGRLRWSQWEKDGQKRSKIEIIVDEIEFMSRNNENYQAPQHQYQQPTQQYQQPQQSYQQQGGQVAYHQPQQQQMDVPPQPQQYTSVYDEDIPF